MTTDIIQICAVIIAVSITSVIAVGSLALVAGIVMVMLGRDCDSN